MVDASAPLRSQFWIRSANALWTDRRRINGVIDLPNSSLDDAPLEQIIMGAMIDVKSELTVNNIDYSAWTNIDLVPVLIRRATTHAVVASLYAHKGATWVSRIIPSITPINVTVVGDDELAMDYWENKMWKNLDDYYSYNQLPKLQHSAEGEDPLFTMADIRPGDATIPTEEEE